jgi:hypothetical protein
MNDVLIMLLSSVIVFHGISRLAALPGIKNAKWRQRALSLSIWLEFSGAIMSFAAAYAGQWHEPAIVLLLSSIALAPFADQRMTRRVAWKKEATQ